MKKQYPLGLTQASTRQYPGALAQARSISSDRAALQPIVTYLVRRQGMALEEVERNVVEYLKFIVLAAATGERVAPSPEADTVWHVHILFTVNYQQFCQKHFGRFIHHVPSDPDDHPPMESFARQRDLATLFYGSRSIYPSTRANCSNSHDCHPADGPVAAICQSDSGQTEGAKVSIGEVTPDRSHPISEVQFN